MPTSRSSRCAALALSITAGLALTACNQSPLFRSKLDYDSPFALQKYREVTPLALDVDEDAPRAAANADPDARLDRAIDRVDEAIEALEEQESVSLTLAQVRAAALRNNLDLDVQLISPAIQRERISEEEGRFDALIFTNANVFENDGPVILATQSNQVNGFNVTPGLRVPLRTGGTFEIRNTFGRTDQNNPFLLLNPADSSTLELSLSHNLLRGAGRRANTAQIRIADLDTQAAEATAKIQVINTLADAERSYWRLYAFQEALTVRAQQYELAVEQLEQADRLVRGGRQAEIEVVRAQSGVADRIEQIVAAERDVLLANRALKRVANIPGLDVDSDTFILPMSDPDPVRFNLDGDKLAEQALEQRMELIELELRVAADEVRVALARNETLPLISANLLYRLNGLGSEMKEAIELSLERDFTDVQLGFNAEFPLTNLQRRSALRQATLSRLQRIATKDAREQQVVQEVLDAVDRLSAGWDRILAAQQAVALNTRTLAAERRQFDVGRSNSVNVLDADTRLAEARLTEIQAVVDYQIAQADLAVATGTLLGAAKVDWEPRIPTED